MARKATDKDPKDPKAKGQDKPDDEATLKGPDFPDIGTDPEAQPQPAGGGEDLDARFAKYEERFAAFEEERKAFQEREARFHDTIEKLMMGQFRQPAATAQPVQEEPAPTLDYSKLPDPVEKPADFARAVEEHNRKYLDWQLNKLSKKSSEPDPQARGAALWAKFTEKYEDLAEYQDLAEVVAQKEVSDLKKRGIDVNAYVTADEDGFLGRVAAKVQARLDAIRGPAGGGEGGDADGLPAKTIGAGRDQVAGGGPAKRGAGGKGEKAPLGFVEALKEQQRKLGFI